MIGEKGRGGARAAVHGLGMARGHSAVLLGGFEAVVASAAPRGERSAQLAAPKSAQGGAPQLPCTDVEAAPQRLRAPKPRRAFQAPRGGCPPRGAWAASRNRLQKPPTALAVVAATETTIFGGL